MKRRTWIYLAFKDNENDYPHSPYFYKIFYNHQKMKNFSAEHSAVEKLKYPNYCSTYLTFNKE